MISIAFQTNKRLSEYSALAQTAESYGFSGISVYNDMLYQPAWLPLLEMARHCHRLRLGPAAVNPFTCHPINIAGNMALLDEATNGRTYLGISRGAWLDFVGLQPRNPVIALKEAIISIRHLWQQSPEPLPGNYFPLAGGDSLRWSINRPDIPILLGAWGEQTIRACLPHVQAIKLGGTANPGAVRWLRQLVGDALEIVVGAVTVVDEDEQDALQLARREVALYLPVVAELDKSLAIDPELLVKLKQLAANYDFAKAASYISDELLLKFAFAGTPEQIGQQTAVLLEAGANRVEWGTPHGLSTASGLRLLGEKVLPALKASS